MLHTDPPKKCSVTFSWACLTLCGRRKTKAGESQESPGFPTNPKGQALQWGKLQDWTTENGASLQHCAGEHLNEVVLGWRAFSYLMILEKKNAKLFTNVGWFGIIGNFEIFVGGYEMKWLIPWQLLLEFRARSHQVLFWPCFQQTWKRKTVGNSSI